MRRAVLGLCVVGWLAPAACGSSADEAVVPGDASFPDASQSDGASPPAANRDASDFVPHEHCMVVPERLDTSGAASAPSLGSSADDGLFAVWSEELDGGARRVVTRRAYSSSLWRDAVTLTEGAVSSARLAVTPSGGATISWLSDVGGNHGERANFLGSSKWSAVETFQDPMALDGTNTWLAAGGSTNALAFVVGANGVLETHTPSGADAGWARETFGTDGVVEPRVNVAEAGDLVVVWHTASPSAVHLRRKRAGVWAPALTSAAAYFTTTGAAQLFEPALLPNGDAIVLWREGTKIATRQLRAGAIDFDDEVTHSTSAAENRVVMLEVDAKGDATLLLHARNGADATAVVRRRIGESWGEAKGLGMSSASWLSVDSDGNAAVIVRSPTQLELHEVPARSHEWSLISAFVDEPTLLPVGLDQARVVHRADRRELAVLWVASVPNEGSGRGVFYTECLLRGAISPGP